MGNKGVWDAFAVIFQFGINMIVPIAICVALGVWLGNRFDISWIVIPLFFVGALAGFTNIFKLAKRIGQQKDKRKVSNVKKNQ